MSYFQRYAIYYLPDDADLAEFGASWLGWDIGTGTNCRQPNVEKIAHLTETPRRYGFHGTLKPPFRLSVGTNSEELEAAVETVARTLSAVTLDGLKLSRLGSFLALVPFGNTKPLEHLAFMCVTKLDRFRHPADEAELAHRRAKGLTERQDALLLQWGYPYVADEFRFHLTLTGSLETASLEDARKAIATHLPELPSPFVIRSIALVGEDANGMFRLIRRFPLRSKHDNGDVSRA